MIRMILYSMKSTKKMQMGNRVKFNNGVIGRQIIEDILCTSLRLASANTKWWMMTSPKRYELRFSIFLREMLLNSWRTILIGTYDWRKRVEGNHYLLFRNMKTHLNEKHLPPYCMTIFNQFVNWHHGSLFLDEYTEVQWFDEWFHVNDDQHQILFRLKRILFWDLLEDNIVEDEAFEGRL